ncbi:MAG: hypothetical protein JSV38_07445, partial [Desulfobacterales bacterium]
TLMGDCSHENNKKKPLERHQTPRAKEESKEWRIIINADHAPDIGHVVIIILQGSMSRILFNN